MTDPTLVAHVLMGKTCVDCDHFWNAEREDCWSDHDKEDPICKEFRLISPYPSPFNDPEPVNE